MSQHTNTFCTLYKLINTINNKIYIGQTWLPTHIRMGKAGCNYKNSIYLYSAIKKYGTENFIYEILAETEDQVVADSLEDDLIILYNSKDSNIGYNIKDGGSVGLHSEATREKISKTLKEKASKWTPEELARRVAPVAGWWAGKKRGPHSAEYTENHSKMMIERHKNTSHPMIGKHHSEESRLKISQSNKGRKDSTETKQRKSLARKMSKERENDIIQCYQNNDKISDMKEKFKTSSSCIQRVLKRNNIPIQKDRGNRQIGRRLSEESKKKISEAKKLFWDKKKNAEINII